MTDQLDRPSGKQVGRLLFAIDLATAEICEADRALGDHTGWAPPELIGRPWQDYVHPDDHRGTVKAAERVMAEHACRWTCRLRHADGSFVVYHCDATLSAGGTVVYVVASDGRVLAEEREDLWQYARLSDLADDLFIVSDRLGNIVTVNAAAERLHGIRREECIGRSLVEYLPPESVEIMNSLPGRYAAGEETIRYTLQAYDHRRRLVTLECVTTFDRDTQRWYTVERDMTERVARERELEISQRFFDLSASQLVLLGTDGRIQQANPAFLSFVATDHDRVVGRTLWEVLGARRDDPLPHAFRTVVAEGVPETLTVAVRASGRSRTLSITLAPSTDATTVFCSSRDITEEQRLADELLQRATHDQLTRLANRDVFDERLEAILRSGVTAAVVMIDLDDFKRVNDTLGHHAGDQLLSLVGARLVNAVRSDDLVARFGGDEFVVLLRGPRAERDAGTVAEKIRHALSDPYTVSGRVLHITTSLGVAVGSAETHSASEIFRQADAAAYLAKRSGRDRSQMFDADLERTLVEEQAIEVELRRALDDGSFDIDVQGIFTIDGEMVGAEALVRLVTADGERLGPERFLDIAANLRLLGRLGERVVERSLSTMGPWLAADPDRTLSVNIDPREIVVPGFVDIFLGATERHGIEPSQLVAEVTERGLPTADGRVPAVLDRLRERGIQIAIDEFGTGASSLGFLRDLRIDALKIDESFVASIDDDPVTEAITAAVIDLATALGVDVMAAGVRRQAHLATLRRLGCRLIQGSVVHEPVPVDRFLTDGSPGRSPGGSPGRSQPEPVGDDL